MTTNSFDITVAPNPLGGLGVRFIGDDSNTGNPELTVAGYKVWHAGNDGAASGLDADLLDGYHASAFVLVADIQNLYALVFQEALDREDADMSMLAQIIDIELRIAP
jgi:hypothetical protein